MIRFFCSLFLRVLAILSLVLFLTFVLPGEAKYYFSGIFEQSGLFLEPKPSSTLNLYSLKQHYGDNWVLDLCNAIFKTAIIATLSMVFSLCLFLFFYFIFEKRKAVSFDFLSGFFMSMISVLLAPLMALIYFRGGFSSVPWAGYMFAAVSISFVGLGIFLKFLNAKVQQNEFLDLDFGLCARGIGSFKKKWVHVSKLLSSDFLVLAISRYAGLVSGVFVAEIVFNIKGLGWFFSVAFQSRNTLMILILASITSIFYLILNRFGMQFSKSLDPRKLSDV